MIIIVTLNPCIDKTIYVKKNDLGKIICSDKVKIIAGGKGNNVARVLNSLDVKNLSLNFLGGYYGKIIEECLKKDGITYKAISINNHSRSVITVLENDLRQTAYIEPGPKVSDIEKEEMLLAFKKILNEWASDIKLVILSGSVSSNNCNNIYKIMIEVAKQKGIRTILDSRDHALTEGIEAKPFLIKPNINEIEQIFNYKIEDIDTIGDSKLANYVVQLNQFADIVILTLGCKGSILSDGKKIYKAIPPEVKVINPVGSGDSFLAGFAYGLYKSFHVMDCLKIATAAGTANASIWDAAYVQKTQIFQFIDKVKIKKIG